MRYFCSLETTTTNIRGILSFHLRISGPPFFSSPLYWSSRDRFPLDPYGGINYKKPWLIKSRGLHYMQCLPYQMCWYILFALLVKIGEFTHLFRPAVHILVCEKYGSRFCQYEKQPGWAAIAKDQWLHIRYHLGKPPRPEGYEDRRIRDVTQS